MPVTAVASKSGVHLGGLKRSKLKHSADFHDPVSDDNLLVVAHLDPP
ncbi:MAG: hypothetical protein ACKVQU_00040 [Burkholderiales bacterium]